MIKILLPHTCAICALFLEPMLSEIYLFDKQMFLMIMIKDIYDSVDFRFHFVYNETAGSSGFSQ